MATKLHCEPLGDRIAPALTSFTYDLGGGVQTGYLDYDDAAVVSGADQTVPLTLLAVSANGTAVTTGDVDPGATVHLVNGQVAGVAFQASALGVQYTNVAVSGNTSQNVIGPVTDQPSLPPPQLDITRLLVSYNLLYDDLEELTKQINGLVKDIQQIQGDLDQLNQDLQDLGLAATDAEKAAIKAQIDALTKTLQEKQFELQDAINVYKYTYAQAIDAYIILQGSGQANNPVPLPPPPTIKIPSGVLPPPPNYVPGYYA